MSAPSQVQYLLLIACSSVLTLAAHNTFGSSNAATAPPVALELRGGVAAHMQLRADAILLNSAKGYRAVESSAQRWLTTPSLVEDTDVPALGADGDAADDSRLIERTATPITELEVARALVEGHKLAFGTVPSTLRLSVAWAHIALENGRGKELYCNNFGNIGNTRAWTGHYYGRLLRERVSRNPDVWKFIPVKFKAFDTPAEGAKAYWELLQSHYPTVLGYFDAGYAFEAARKLSNNNYATALVEPYALSMAKLAQEFRSRIEPDIPELH